MFIESILEALLKIIENPVEVALLLIVGAELLAIRQLFKMIDKKDKQINNCSEGLATIAEGLGKLTILIEILVHGRRRE